MAALHPELAQLRDRFDALLDDFEAGSIDYDTAEMTLKSLVAIDGTGAHWSLDEEGNFYRSMPGGAKQPADPISFRPPQLPERPAANIPHQAAPWAAQPTASTQTDPVDLHTPPTGFLAQSPGAFDPFTAQPNTSTFPGAGMPAGFPEDDRPAGAVGPGRRGTPSTRKEKAPKASRMPSRPGSGGPRKAAGPGFVTGIVDKVASINFGHFLQTRGKTIFIAVGCLVALYVGYTQIAGNDTPESGIPGAAVEAPADMPVDAALSAPNGDQVAKVVSAVTSGDADVARGAVQQPLDNLGATQSAALLAGVETYGMAIKPGPLNGTTQNWTLVQGEKELGTAQVTYVLDGETWKLTTWPVFRTN